MSVFDDFESMRSNSKKRADEARMMNEKGVMPEVGGFYTVSPDFVCGDRSYLDCIWEVLAANETHVLVRLHGERFSLNEKPRLFRPSDRYWYEAGNLYASMKVEGAA